MDNHCKHDLGYAERFGNGKFYLSGSRFPESLPSPYLLNPQYSAEVFDLLFRLNED